MVRTLISLNNRDLPFMFTLNLLFPLHLELPQIAILNVWLPLSLFRLSWI